MRRYRVAVERHVLPSGLTVLLEPLPWVRSAALGYYLKAGSAAETLSAAGATHFLEHLIFKGTETRSTRDIAAAIDELGGDVDAFTSKEYTAFYAHVLDEQIDFALELLTDIVTRPRFSDEDLEMERGVVLEELRMVEDTPDDLVHEMFIQSFWSGHPLGRPILGTEESVRSLGREIIERHYRETFHPKNMVFCASGNIQPKQLLEKLEKEFDAGKTGPEPNGWSTPDPLPHVQLRQKHDLEQVHLLLGTAGIPQESEDRFAAALFNAILGGGMSSRLFQKIREKEGLVYTVTSYHTAHRQAGYESVYAACAPKNVKKVVDLTIRELRSFRDSGASESELAAAKRYLKGSILLSLESTVSRMSGMARQEYYFGQQFTPDEIIARIDSVHLDDVQKIASQVVDPATVSLTLLGNVKKPSVTATELRHALE